MSIVLDQISELLFTLATHLDTPLPPDSLRHLVREYGHKAAYWRQFGLQLGVPNDKLREIQANHAGHPNQCQLCLTDMFDWWLKNTPNPTIEHLPVVVNQGSGKSSITLLAESCFESVPILLQPETETKMEIQTESETDEPPQPQVKKKSGLRKIWSTFQRCTADFVKSALGKLSGLFASLDIRRKYKKSKDVVRWWFEVEGDENKLQALEREWGVIQASTQWKLE